MDKKLTLRRKRKSKETDSKIKAEQKRQELAELVRDYKKKPFSELVN